jgi:hypothetical protein
MQKKELKTVTMCEKCKVPLHISCFKEGFIILLKGLSHCIRFKKEARQGSVGFGGRTPYILKIISCFMMFY